MKYSLTASIVLYNNSEEIVKRTISSFLATSLSIKLILVDNSPSNELRHLCDDCRVEYIHNPSNPGFGSGHNTAIRRIANESKYHLVLNPDVYFNDGVLENIVKFMENDPQIGALMPKVLYPDGRIQYVAKLLPTPLNFFIRRLLPFKRIVKRIDERFELRISEYNNIMEVPFLSGCFIVFPTAVVQQVAGFDENIFMYTEDIDICRRIINAGYKTIFYPDVFIFHDHQRKSFLSYKNLKVYTKSAIYYFNKWGWFWDTSRREINARVLSQFLPKPISCQKE